MLAFPLFGFEVRVHPTFLILLVFVIDSGLSGTSVVLWLAAAFVSILIHELGHAFTARGFGGQVQAITLHGMGGVTTWLPPAGLSGLKRFAISAAGAGLGFVVAGLLYGAVAFGWLGSLADRLIPTPWGAFLGTADDLSEYLIFFIGAFLWVSVVWGVINWLPIGGLDGSHMLREVLRKVVGSNADVHAAIIGVIFAIAAAVVFVNWGYSFAPLIFLFFAFTDVMRVVNQRR